MESAIRTDARLGSSAERRRRAGLLLGPRPLFHRIPIPAGLERTLEDLSREVLRHQPQNVYQFCADFFHTRLAAREAQLTDKLLEGAVTEEQQVESTGQKNVAAAVTQRNGDTKTAEGDHSQDDASDEVTDDDKALLLGALGATAAGAVTVGAVAGALKAAQDRGEQQKIDQDRSEPLTTADDQGETLKTDRDQQETLKTTQDQGEPLTTARDQSESPATALGTAAPDTSDEPPGDGGAAAAAAAIVGTGGAVTAAALTGAALQSDDETPSAAATSDLPQRSGSGTEGVRRESTTSDGKVETTDPVTEEIADEKSQIPSPEAEREDDEPAISSPEHSDASNPNEAAKSPAVSADDLPAKSRDHTPLQLEPAVSASPDDSVFDDKQEQSQPESPTERQQSPALATDVDGDTSTHATEPETRPQSSPSGRESPTARLTEPPGTGPDPDKEDGPSHSSSPVADSPVQTATEQDDSRIHTPGNESIAPSSTDKNEITAEPLVKESSDQSSEIDDQVKEMVTPSTAIEESPFLSEIVEEDSRVQSSTSADDKEATAVGDERRMQFPAEEESLIQPTVVEEQSAVQASVAEDDSYIPSTTPMEKSGDQSNRSDVDSLAQSAHSEKENQPSTSEAVSITASVDTAEQEPPKEDRYREEVDTPKIVAAKRLSHSSPEYEKFMSILVSPKGGRQPSVEQTGIEAATKQRESNEQSQAPSESAIDSEVKSEDPSGILQKHEDEVEGRAESSADAVYGSATDLQTKIDSVQSPVPSVKEDPIVKVDRFSISSDVSSASVGSRKESGSDDVNSGAVSSPSAIKDDTNVDGSQLDSAPALTETELVGDIGQKGPESDAGNAEVSGLRDLPSVAQPSEDALERDASSDVFPNKNESTQGLQTDLDLAEDAGLRDPPTSAEPAEETDMAHDISERTEDYDFDPLARTQSFIFPDELAGRSSQLSEKPSSPFPELDESDIQDASATLSSTEAKLDMEEADKATPEANMAAPEESMSASEANMTAPETEKSTPLTDVAPEGFSATPAADTTTSETDKRDQDLPSDIGQTLPVAETVTSEAEKGADETENETAESGLAAQQVDAEETAPETTENPSQSAVAEETDDSQKNPKQTEQPPPEIDQAATTIQAGVRGWQTRRKISRQQDAATQIQAGFRGWRVRHGRRMRRTSSLPDLSKAATSDDQYMDVDTLKDRAAAKIQAGFRGWRTRQDMKSLAAPSPLEDAPRVSPAISMVAINAEEQAAVRIQAGYRGWKTRNTLKRSLSDPNSEALVLAESQRQKRVTETGAGASGPQSADVNERLTSSVEDATPRDEDETAHSIQSIQSEIASSGGTPRQEDNAPTITPPATEHSSATQLVGEPSQADPSVTDTSTVEPSVDSPSVSNLYQADPSTVDPSVAPLLSADESQQAEAATKIQAGFRGWKTRQQMRTDPVAVRPTVSAKSVTDSGALPIDFAIVHRPEDDWLTQDLLKIEAEKRASGGETAPEAETAGKLVASPSDEPDGKEGKDARPDSASTTESSSSWLTHAQTEIRASFQGLRDNVSDALKTVEDTARLVQEKGAAAGAEGGAEGGAVVVTEDTQRVAESGAGAPEPVSEGPQGSSTQAKKALAPLKPDGQTGMGVNSVDTSEKSPSEREEEEIWEEIQRSMRHED